ncbi:hypothetical protein F2Q70_00034908 [Brassica cretica]|uniref:Serine hydroxymethyltransferase-like domain-containing protein n=1 Tax=Brassica cretica TaxID=69181 RepID=A0A8S9JTM2_BRACR|nr:hypothetical protein F2Q70_00034908 [Brassica cretica]
MQAGGGIDNHLLLWDLTPLGLTGKVYDKVCEMCHITLNKTAIFGDNGTISHGGVRIHKLTYLDTSDENPRLYRTRGYIAAAQQGAKTNHRSIVYAMKHTLRLKKTWQEATKSSVPRMVCNLVYRVSPVSAALYVGR